MKYIEAFSETEINNYEPEPNDLSVFLAGGISNCQNWQKEVVKQLKYTNLVVLNPRRDNFPMNDSNAASIQIQWEFEHLKKASMIMFWFPPETLCPITLFEYGKWIVKDVPLFVGCDPNYQRFLDVKIQTQLERPTQKVHMSLKNLLDEIISFSERK